MFMCGVWWRPRFLSKELKVESDIKKQKHLGSCTAPKPVDVSIQSSASKEPEDYQFTAAAVGADTERILGLPPSKASPYDDQDGEIRSSDSDTEEENDNEDEDDDEDK
jgi:hypothetical protein